MGAMLKRVWKILFSIVTLSALTAEGRTIDTIEELRKSYEDTSCAGRPFVVTGEVCAFQPDFHGAWMYTIRSGTNTCFVAEPAPAAQTAPGPRTFNLLDRIRVSGRMTVVEDRLRAVFDKSELLERGDLDKIPVLNSGDFTTKKFVHRIVRLSGRIRNAVRDDIDPNYIRMTLHDSGGIIALMVMEPPQFPSDFSSLVGAYVTAVGRCDDGRKGLHRHFGTFLEVSGLSSITVSASPEGFDTAPDIAELENVHPRRIAAAGFFRASGEVLAVWGENAFLTRTQSGNLTSVRLRKGERLPRFGDFIQILGLPTTDISHINLVYARWKMTTGDGKATLKDPVDTCAADLMTDKHGFPKLVMHYHGKPIRLKGVVRYIPDHLHGSAPIQLESDGQIIAVDASALNDAKRPLEIGCRVSIAGTCVMDMGDFDTELGSQNSGRIILVPRTPNDITILSRPSWWTPHRLMALLGIFAAALLGVLGWNVSLNRRAKAKGRELAAEQLAHVTSELKISERTRLAVELHDSLSQTLTGVSMQIDTAAGLVRQTRPDASKCLDIASRTIDACRMELRNTLWDLRSDALDAPDMNTAIRKTLFQNLSNVDLSVRFNVPRATFSDNTAHAILKIVRELASNAIRHGKANKIRIAGAAAADKILFSVKDNGCGFDPDSAPGICEGHFGLQGIAERLERLNGEMSVKSAPGQGTKITIALHIPRLGE